MRKKTLASLAIASTVLAGCVGVQDEPQATTTLPTTTTSTVAATSTTTTTIDPDDLDNWSENVVQFLVETQFLEQEFSTEYLVGLGFEMCEWTEGEAERKLVVDTYGEHDGNLLLDAAEEWLCNDN